MRTFIKLLMAFWAICVFAVEINAQSITVKGTVSSTEDNIPLPGVNVIVKGSGAGTTTDLEGKYQLNAGKDDVLLYSFIGMKTEEIPVNGRTTIDVKLKSDVSQLSEVVVVGYGSVDRKLLTGSVAQADSKELSNTINPDISSSLQGKVAGVQVNQNSGTPGAALSIQVRGQNSISGGTQPLYVVDGVPITSENLGQISYEGQGISAISDLNPNDIESISILKDASASAIYGARGANGVVLITTKSGEKGATKFSLNSYYGTQQIYKKLDLLDAGQFKQYVNDIAADEERPEVYSEEQINNNPVDTDWQDAVLRIAPIQNHQLTASGGGEKTKFYASTSIFDQEGIIIGTDYTRYSGRLNLDHKVNNKLSIDTKLNISFSENNRVPGDQTINGVLPNAISKPPVDPIYDENGNYVEQGFWDNPVANGSEADNVAESFRTLFNIGWDYRITDDLKFRNQVGLDYYHLMERRYEPTTTRRGAQSGGIGVSANTRVTKLVQNSTLEYNKYINKAHDITALVGSSFEIINDRFDFIRANNFPTNDLRYISGAGNIESATASGSEYAINSFFGRLMYAFKDKYILTLNVRADGSSNIAPDNRYQVLPGVSVGWRLIEESFMQNQSIFNDLKLRLGYGKLGNDQIGRARFLSLYGSGFNYNSQPGIIPVQIPNPDLSWEVTTNTNVGMDMAFLSGKLQLTADAYYNVTTDFLQFRPLPGSSGYAGFDQNIGELENRGLEFALNGTLLSNDDFQWTTNANISINRNKILSLYEGQPIINQGRGNNALIEGQPIGVFYMLKSLGVDPSTGELVMEDVNRDGLTNDQDQQIVGDPNPDFTGGISTNLNYKNIDLSIVSQFSYGNDIFNGTRQYTENMNLGSNDNQATRIDRRWREPGDITNVPKINGRFNNEITSHYIEDGSFFRLRNITLGYRFPVEWISKIKLTNVRIYASAQNILTLTPYSGMDPDVNYSGTSGIRKGTDFFTFPVPKMYTAGINISF
ncbi:TonB-dependent receptor [Marivirga sp. S37H4]|uniref:TonB-dependent receptor n=1 Tax=Marivirga aurantiaca TaxID=2802615 RepID=A0A935CAQ0_9BACT|nr:TonB-dependent receptor [Marivirga aurantiaca]MBK6266891.1 TonB-dependent receptor [Marivirga aurantiaca]